MDFLHCPAAVGLVGDHLDRAGNAGKRIHNLGSQSFRQLADDCKTVHAGNMLVHDHLSGDIRNGTAKMGREAVHAGEHRHPLFIRAGRNRFFQKIMEQAGRLKVEIAEIDGQPVFLDSRDLHARLDACHDPLAFNRCRIT